MGHRFRLYRRAHGRPQGKLIAAVKALYWRRPTAAELGDFGVTPEDFPEPHIDLWPENWPPIQLFTRNCTQWRVGMAGPVGLDYGVIFHELDRQGVTGDDYDDMMGCIRIIETAALEAINEK